MPVAACVKGFGVGVEGLSSVRMDFGQIRVGRRFPPCSFLQRGGKICRLKENWHSVDREERQFILRLVVTIE